LEKIAYKLKASNKIEVFQIESLVMQDLPNSLRQTFYQLLLDSQLFCDLKPVLLPQSFINQAKPDEVIKINEIQRKLDKFFPQEFISSHQDYFQKLSTILFAYSLCDIDLCFHPQFVPYAGFILKYMDETYLKIIIHTSIPPS
jgi:hypothetical protein